MMFIFTAILTLALTMSTESAPSGWKQAAPGMDLQNLVAMRPSSIGDSRITVVRIDPHLWELVFMGTSQTGEVSGKTAREWCKSRGLTAVINAGMFDSDNRTHLGFLKFRDNLNNSRVNNYQSVIAFDPKKEKELPPFQIFDLDEKGVTTQSILKDYNSAIQNLRLIKKPGINKWNQQNRKWSEAAIGEDTAGRILFIFSKSPFSMHDLNNELLESDINIVAAQHLEGGPEAQLYLHLGDVEIDLFGSYETSFNENDENSNPWPIPNILGIRPRMQVENK